MPSKDEAAQNLAAAHYQIEEGITKIFRLTCGAEAEGRSSEPIKLLEVNANTIAAGVLPLGFDAIPAAGIPFPSVIVEVTPEEFARIEAKELSLPSGWAVGELMPNPMKNGVR